MVLQCVSNVARSNKASVIGPIIKKYLTKKEDCLVRQSSFDRIVYTLSYVTDRNALLK
jgi:hypothetical protein